MSKWLMGLFKNMHFILSFKLEIMEVDISYLWEGTQVTQEILFQVKMGKGGLLQVKIMMIL